MTAWRKEWEGGRKEGVEGGNSTGGIYRRTEGIEGLKGRSNGRRKGGKKEGIEGQKDEGKEGGKEGIEGWKEERNEGIEGRKN